VTKPLRLVGGAVAVLGVTACSQLPNFGAEDPASSQGSRILELWQLFVIAAAVVGGIVYALIFFVIVRYRRRGDDELPAQTEGNNRLETIYTVLPIVIVIGLFAATMATQIDIDSTADEPDVVIEVVGFQWQWQFNYVGEDVSITGAPDIDPELVLPLDSTVRFRLTSRDVIHSFFVPGFLYKRDVIPGVDNEFDVTVTEAGTFEGHCAEFCGLLHDRMSFQVRTVPAGEFQAWLEEHRR
jgi:cytochrome c oxidase subunit II